MIAGLLAASEIGPYGVAHSWQASVAQLQHMPVLAGFAVVRWEQVCLDCAALVDGWGAEMLRLGWSAEDAFGVHPNAPGAAVHCYGLGVLLNGGSVVAMTAAGAVIEGVTKVRQSFTRRRAQGAVPIWTVAR